MQENRTAEGGAVVNLTAEEKALVAEEALSIIRSVGDVLERVDQTQVAEGYADPEAELQRLDVAVRMLRASRSGVLQVDEATLAILKRGEHYAREEAEGFATQLAKYDEQGAAGWTDETVRSRVTVSDMLADNAASRECLANNRREAELFAGIMARTAPSGRARP